MIGTQLPEPSRVCSFCFFYNRGMVFFPPLSQLTDAFHPGEQQMHRSLNQSPTEHLRASSGSAMPAEFVKVHI